MKKMWTIALMLEATFVLGAGCAKPDWIQDTLVTVDVTGTWVRAEGPPVELKLEQRGAKVTGSMRARAAFYGGVFTSETVEGSVSGDVFRFTQTSGRPTSYPLRGEMKVNGDEMTGLPWGLLRRADSSPPASQP
jgi:hypothetical protein